MLPRYALEIANRTLQDIMNNDIPFGGKIMIMGGGFRQLLPVQVHATRTQTINLSIKFSSLWKHFRTFSLQQNMRALPEETEFVQFLLDVGNGKINDIDDKLVLPNQCLVSTRNNIVTDVYQGIIRGKRYHELTGTAILSARNIDVDAINQEVIELLDISTEKIYTAVDSTENCDNGAFDDAILTEYLNTLNPPNIAPYELRLRQYAIVMRRLLESFTQNCVIDSWSKDEENIEFRGFIDTLVGMETLTAGNARTQLLTVIASNGSGSQVPSQP
ncbi:uncharacterized protein LOC141526503 [Cotesia typhae]|uniref:uncharacterized protein LOC141526503 n=1 Tax=Cotesia typhae TaxID=2053667 RepID=UPI003D68C689